MSHQERHTPQDALDSFEVFMAKLLCRELSTEHRKHLTRLVTQYPELRKRYEEYVAMHKLLHRFKPQTLRHAFLDASPERGKLIPLSPAQRRKNKKNITISTKPRSRVQWLSLAASLPVALGLGLWLWIGFFSEPTVSPIAIRLSFAYGKCLGGNGARLKIGKILNREIRTAQKSLCDLQVEGDESGRYALRLFPNSRLRFERSKQALHLFLKRGGLLVKAEKRSGGGLAVLSAGHRITILGTRFFVERMTNSKLRVDVLDGAALVESSRYLHSAELSLRATKDEQRRLAKEFPKIFTKKDHVVEGGRGILLAWDPKARQLLTGIDKRIRQITKDKGRPPGKDEFETLLKEYLDKKEPRLAKKLPLVQEHPYKLPLRKIRALKEAASRLSLKPASIKGNTHGTTKKKPGTQESIPARRILAAYKGKETPSLFYRFRLKNGTILSGMAHQQGNFYIVKSKQGIRKIPKNEVARIEVFFE